MIQTLLVESLLIELVICLGGPELAFHPTEREKRKLERTK
jgi:hypothetical protein